MADFPYTTVPGKISELLTKIKTVGVPDKAINPWLKSIGFTSSNDSSLLPILKFVDLTSDSGVPTQRWKQFRGAESKKVLADGIRKGYSELFATYPNANQCSDDDLSSYFSTKSSAGQQVISKTVSTFKNLCSAADFSGGQTPEAPMRAPATQTSVASPPAQMPTAPRQPEVHIDVQIHIASDASADQIDQIFASMAKHLYGREDS